PAPFDVIDSIHKGCTAPGALHSQIPSFGPGLAFSSGLSPGLGLVASLHAQGSEFLARSPWTRQLWKSCVWKMSLWKSLFGKGVFGKPLWKNLFGKGTFGKGIFGKILFGKRFFEKKKKPFGKDFFGRCPFGKGPFGKGPFGKGFSGKSCLEKDSLEKACLGKAHFGKASLEKVSLGAAFLGKAYLGKAFWRSTRCRRACWTLLLLASLAMLYWQFALMFSQFWAYPVVLTMSMHSEPKMFPAVTVCNLDPYRFELVREHLEQLDRMAEESLTFLYGSSSSSARWYRGKEQNGNGNGNRNGNNNGNGTSNGTSNGNSNGNLSSSSFQLSHNFSLVRMAELRAGRRRSSVGFQ
ncbi:Amiloride-sensitive sodium channel subunit alpha, partial [Lamprotornis superbus]